MEHRTLKQKPTQRAGPQESKGIAFTEGVERGMGDMGLIRLSQQHWVINRWDVSSGRSRGVSCAFWGEIHGGGDIPRAGILDIGEEWSTDQRRFHFVQAS